MDVSGPGCLRRRRNRRRSPSPPACVSVGPTTSGRVSISRRGRFSQFDSNSEEFKIVLTAAALVLLLLVAACANLGTLVLARGVTREREIRVRMALGAGRLRVVRQLFTESLLLAVLSGLCALLLSTVVLKVIQLQHEFNRKPGSGLARARRHIRRRDAGGAGLRAAAGVSARQPGAACGTRQHDIPRRTGGRELSAAGRVQSSGQQPATAWRHRPRLRLPPSRLDFAGPEGPWLWGTRRAGVSRSASCADCRIAGRESDIPGLARAVERPPHGSELDGAPVRGQSRGSAIPGHDGDAPRAWAQLPAGRRRRGDRQRSDGARAVAGPGCPRQIAPVGSSRPDGDWRRAKRLDRLRRQSRTPGILPAAIAKRRAGLRPAGPCLRLAARCRPASPGHGPRSRRAAATDGAGGHGYVRPGSGRKPPPRSR